MNYWKISTIALAFGMTVMGGKLVSNEAHAAAGNSAADNVGWDWGAEQPHMERALHDLHAARSSLEGAAEHKGGWRVLALQHTDEAIHETERGIEYGKHHPHE